MARGRSETLVVTKIDRSGTSRQPDELIVEEPLQIQLDGVLVSTTMRTPGNDFELAAGFCFTEGLLAGVPVTGVRYCADDSAAATAFNVVTVETGGRAPAPTPRLGVTSSSCGLCGSEVIDQLGTRLPALVTRAAIEFPAELLVQIPERARSTQGLFASTGAVHAAVVFDVCGGIVLTREDVGRHNAVDKVVGRLLLDGHLPADGLGLFVSGRASFEIVAKAWAAGFGVVVSVSAPTALAVHTARRANMMLVGFTRPGRLNLYAPERFPSSPV